jgi:hypothetical protein
MLHPCIRWLPVVAALFGWTSGPALASDQVHDEIQVYNAEIAEVGQWTYQQHLNYAAIGQTQSEFSGASHRTIVCRARPSSYGLTEWWEAGFYLRFAVTGTGEFLSDGAKTRSLFVSPDAEKRNFFYGVNFELSYELPPFAPSPLALEIRPIIGVRNKEWEFIVNPIVDVSFGPGGETDFAPAARLARNLGNDRFVGLEYYSFYGKIGNILPLQQQYQELYVVTDFKVKDVDVELGVGRGDAGSRWRAGRERFLLFCPRCHGLHGRVVVGEPNK